MSVKDFIDWFYSIKSKNKFLEFNENLDHIRTDIRFTITKITDLKKDLSLNSQSKEITAWLSKLSKLKKNLIKDFQDLKSKFENLLNDLKRRKITVGALEKATKVKGLKPILNKEENKKIESVISELENLEKNFFEFHSNNIMSSLEDSIKNILIAKFEEKDINDIISRGTQIFVKMNYIREELILKIQEIDNLLNKVIRGVDNQSILEDFEKKIKEYLRDNISKIDSEEIASAIIKEIRAAFPNPENQITVNYERDKRIFTIELSLTGVINLSHEISLNQKKIEETTYWFFQNSNIRTTFSQINYKCSTKHHKDPFKGNFADFQKARGAA